MCPRQLRVLFVDDDPLEGRILKANFGRRARVHADLVGSAEEALVALAREPYDSVITDLAMSGVDGIELVRRIRQSDPSLPTFLVTAHATVPRAVDGIRAGANDFLPKPVNTDALLALVERAVAERPVREEVSRRLASQSSYDIGRVIVGTHSRLDEVRQFAEQVAGVSSVRILITGESGTGKSVLARAIHDLSDSDGRFMEVNCAAIPANLLESELFGHEKGAFTDAKALKRGLIELAHEGTLLLDEIGALPLELQGKLLLFLESQEIRRVGGTHPIPITCRVVAATNEDLKERVRQREFRLDLLYRLDVASIEMPALREMAGVIPEIAARFVHDLSEDLKRPTPEIDADSFADLQDYSWPGNARELRNAIERALIFHGGGPLRIRPPAREPDGLTAGADAVALDHGLALEEVERRYIAATLAYDPDRQMEDTARLLGISRKTLWEKRRRYGL